MENKPLSLAVAIRQVLNNTISPTKPIVESTNVIHEAPGSTPDKFDTSDQRSLKMVLKQFEMSDDFDEILAAVHKSGSNRLSNFLIALVVELDDNQSLLKALGKSYRSE